MRGEISSARQAKRHPLDWYVEEGWEWDQIAEAIGVGDEKADGAFLWDPAAGYGHMGSRMENWGFARRIILSDVVENVAYDDFWVRPRFISADFLEVERAPATPVSIWSNPPFSYRKGISEAFVRHALKLATHRVVMLLPAKWLAAGKARGKLFRFDHPPQLVLHFTQRPSMPPGDRIHLMGNRAYRGGMVDYCALVWDVRNPTLPGDTRTIWLPRLGEQ